MQWKLKVEGKSMHSTGLQKRKKKKEKKETCDKTKLIIGWIVNRQVFDHYWKKQKK